VTQLALGVLQKLHRAHLSAPAHIADQPLHTPHPQPPQRQRPGSAILGARQRPCHPNCREPALGCGTTTGHKSRHQGCTCRLAATAVYRWASCASQCPSRCVHPVSQNKVFCLCWSKAFESAQDPQQSASSMLVRSPATRTRPAPARLTRRWQLLAAARVSHQGKLHAAAVLSEEP
jgi:hypothetical protein